jgi:hypothetical protein
MYLSYRMAIHSIAGASASEIIRRRRAGLAVMSDEHSAVANWLQHNGIWYFYAPN